MKKSKDNKKVTIFTFLFFIFFILIVIIPNLYYNLAIDQQLEVRMLALSIFLGLLFLPLIIIKKRGFIQKTNIKILKNPLVLIYTILIILIGISIFWATNQSEAIYEFLKRFTFFILFIYLIIYVLPLENSKLAFIKSFVLFSLIISITGIFQIINLFLKSKYNIESIYLVTGNFAQKNIFSEVLFITFAFSIYGISIFEKNWKKAAILGTLLNLLLIAFLMTRAIWVGFFVSLSLTLVLYFFYASKNILADKLKIVLRSFVIIFSLTLLSVIVISLVDKNKTIQHHISNTFDFEQGNTFHRLNLWKKSILLAQKNPLFGIGAGNWRIEILQYDLQVTTKTGRIMPDRAHNDYLQVLVENGIAGLTTFLIMFVLLIFFCIKTLKKADKLQDNFFILILFFSLMGYIVDSAFAFPRERIELQIFLNIICAFIVYEYDNRFEKRKDTKSQYSIKQLAVIIFCLLSVTSLSAFKRLKAEVGISRIYEYDKLNNYNQIIKITNEIYSPFSTISPYNDPILKIRARALYQDNNNLNLVFETYEKSLKDSPYHIETFNDLAIIYENLKNYSKALEYCKIVLQYSPTDIQANITKSNILLTTNKIEEAYKIIRTINPDNNNPNYKNAVNFILINKIKNILHQTKNEHLKTLIKNTSEKSDFLFEIYCKSINNNEYFERTFLNTIFSGCNQDKIIDDESVVQLKLKYKILK